MISGRLKLWDMNFLNFVQKMKNNELSVLRGGFCLSQDSHILLPPV